METNRRQRERVIEFSARKFAHSHSTPLTGFPEALVAHRFGVCFLRWNGGAPSEKLSSCGPLPRQRGHACPLQSFGGSENRTIRPGYCIVGMSSSNAIGFL